MKEKQRNSVTFESALGNCRLSWTDRGLTSIHWPGEGTPDPEGRWDDVPGFVTDAIRRIRSHLAGTPEDFKDLPVDLQDTTPFRRRVLEAARGIPTGETRTYGELARAVGSPGAARAVGQAMATNPMPVVIPCHRILAAGSSMGGFSAPGGVETKRRLLRIEGAETG